MMRPSSARYVWPATNCLICRSSLSASDISRFRRLGQARHPVRYVRRPLDLLEQEHVVDNDSVGRRRRRTTFGRRTHPRPTRRRIEYWLQRLGALRALTLPPVQDRLVRALH